MRPEEELELRWSFATLRPLTLLLQLPNVGEAAVLCHDASHGPGPGVRGAGPGCSRKRSCYEPGSYLSAIPNQVSQQGSNHIGERPQHPLPCSNPQSVRRIWLFYFCTFQISHADLELQREGNSEKHKSSKTELTVQTHYTPASSFYRNKGYFQVCFHHQGINSSDRSIICQGSRILLTCLQSFKKY